MEMQEIDYTKGEGPVPEENPALKMPEEVRLHRAEAELFQALAGIFQKYALPESVSVLVMRSVLLDLTSSQLKIALMAQQQEPDPNM